jgi:hypothetical protein
MAPGRRVLVLQGLQHEEASYYEERAAPKDRRLLEEEYGPLCAAM